MITAKKSVLLIALLVFIVAMTSIGIVVIPHSSAAADADEIIEGDSENSSQEFVGYDLSGDYQVSIAYHSYNTKYAGPYYAFVITFDQALLMEIIDEADDLLNLQPEIFTYIGSLFRYNGYTVSKDNKGRLIAYLSFDSLTDYYIASGRDGYEVNQSSGDKRKSFLFIDYYTQMQTVFSRIEEEGNILNAILQSLYGVGAERDRILLTYTYGTPYKMISSEADNIVYNTNRQLYLHSFNMTMATSDRTIHLRQHSPNSVGWYSLAIIIAIPVIAFPLAIAVIRHRKNKEE